MAGSDGTLYLFGHEMGTAFQGGSFAALLSLLGLAIAAYFKYAPAMAAQKNEGKKIDLEEDQQIRADYAAQIADFRKEVHSYRNELAKVASLQAATEKRLNMSEATSRRRSYRIDNMMFVIRLLISELRRLDPDSVIVKQAEAMLLQMQDEDRLEGLASNQSPALAAAVESERAAAHTVAVVAKEEEDHR